MIRRLKRVLAWHPEKIKETSWLDGLRGVAAFEVMVTHYQGQFGFEVLSYGMSPDTYNFWRLPLFRPLYHSGNAMVCVFFVISGYVLSVKSLRLLRENNNNNSKEAFYESMTSSIFRRYMRLYLPAMISTLISFVLVCLAIEGTGPTGIPPNLPTVSAQFENYMRENIRFMNIFNYPSSMVGTAHRYSNVIWTIPVEFIGSMIIYLLLLGTASLSRGLRNNIIFAVAMVALLSGHWEILCFAAGTLLADFDLSPPQPRRSCVILFFVAVYMVGTPIRRYPGQQVFGYNYIYALIPERYFNIDLHRTIWAYASILMVFSIPRFPRIRKVLEGSVCQYLGRVSFSVYLVHMMVVHTVGGPIKRFLYMQFVLTDAMIMAGLDASEVGVAVSYFIWMPVVCFITLVVAGTFYQWVDKPSVEFTRRFEHTAKRHDGVNPGDWVKDVQFRFLW